MGTWRNEEPKIVEKQKKRHHTRLGSSAVLNIAFEREWKKRSYYHTGYSRERTRRDTVLVVWWLTTERWIACKQWPFWCYWLEALKQVKAHWDYEEIVQKGNGKRILLKTFMKLSVRETETIINSLTPAYCPIRPKQVIILIFTPLIFLLFIFPANISDFFSLCYLFSS